MVKNKTSLSQDVDKVYQAVKSGNYFGISSIVFDFTILITSPKKTSFLNF